MTTQKNPATLASGAGRADGIGSKRSCDAIIGT